MENQSFRGNLTTEHRDYLLLRLFMSFARFCVGIEYVENFNDRKIFLSLMLMFRQRCRSIECSLQEMNCVFVC